MSDDDLFANDPVILGVIDAARNASGSPRATPEHKQLIDDQLRSLISSCQLIDHDVPDNIARLTVSSLILEAIFLVRLAHEITDVWPYVEMIDRGKKGDAGRASGKKRRENAENGWRAHATELAISLRSKKPNLSQDDLASEVQAMWQLHDIEAPGHSSIVKHVKRQEAIGVIPKRRTGCVRH